MEANNYLQDLKDIKDLMNKSSQFISLSGLSGILAGVYALIGAWIANALIENNTRLYITLESVLFKQILLIAGCVLAASLITAYLLTVNKAKKMGEKVWNASSKRLLINFAIPLVTGGIFALLLLKNGYYGLVAPIMLLFYGMACLNASKYTLRDVRYLGLTEIILGLFAVEFSGYGLYFWVLGFGVCHILYGTVMYYKYDRK
ncbi:MULTISPECIES: hypothetical protein [unclassified Flavobacterium]|uniref:hypothetical protein n=1 Tax=unclassified Flavobacterium TaxID=196869 RepID=UPI00096234C3|nr:MULTISPECIES: hypothetical protein [unclassified Flavobacterium]MBN9284195.1 hypothetical protein [Flavobacterium sp.]OJV70721.1 MAG: hypothetical protein BGO42_14495 [Flavobacterium sp. 40-81]